jgi:hypothetical protein
MSTVVPARRTYPGSRWAWVDTRFRALVAVLTRGGLPFDTALAVARAVLAHLIRETGWGRNEWNNAPGNIKCRGTTAPEGDDGWHGDCHSLTNRTDGTDLYRSYPTIDDGLADYLRTLQSRRYRAAWVYLVRTGDGLGWYDQLMRAGYHPWSQTALDEYAQIWRVNVPRLARSQPNPWRFLDALGL